jgi:hypothetical protein
VPYRKKNGLEQRVGSSVKQEQPKLGREPRLRGMRLGEPEDRMTKDQGLQEAEAEATSLEPSRETTKSPR